MLNVIYPRGLINPLIFMTKPTIQELLRNKVLIPASELSEFKEAKALACKIFEDAAFEQYRNQRHQTPKAAGSITKPYKRESCD